MMLKPGMYLQDRYEILEQIGVGGMSEVYRARCHKLNRLVAIKLLKEEFSRDTNFVSKFKMEAQSAAGLSHPNIVSVYDVVDEGDLHYIVMEVIEGITLKSYILKKGCLGVKESIGIAIQVAQGIAAAHDQHIIHRDIKPQNMIISRDGKVKVADFGIARAVSSQTIGTTAVGSVHYISPEQARGGYSDVRSDLYSLGITMYEMVTGQVPFDGDNTVTIALAHLEKSIVPACNLNPEITPSLNRIIMKCTQKKPERRYSNAYELIADLRRALVDPDDNFMKPEIADDSSPTMIIGAEDLNAIKEGSGKAETLKTEENVSLDYEDIADHTPKHKPKKGRNLSDDVNPQIEKILTTVGIAAAVIIVIVVVTMLTQVGGGILNFGSGKKESAATESMQGADVTQEAVVTEAEPVTEASQAGTLDLAALGLENMKGEDAKLLLEKNNLNVTLLPENSDKVAMGMVTRFEPLLPAAGDNVNLYVSSGSAVPTVKVPDITNVTPEVAKAALDAVSLVLGNATEERSENIKKGTIIRQTVIADSLVPAGTVIDYTVSTGGSTKYVAVVNDDFPLKDLLGPGSGDDQLKVQIVMKQNVNGQEVTKILLAPRMMGGDITIPVHFQIEGAEGVLTGEVQIQDLTSNRVLKTYPLEFVEVSR